MASEEESPDEESMPAAEGGPEESIPPPSQPLRVIGAIGLTAFGFGLYEYLRASFWSGSWMGIHDAIPWPAYAILALALASALLGLRAAIGIHSPHAKLGLGLFAFFACVAIGYSGGRFVSYTIHGTLNPPFTLKLKPGDRFPEFALADQTGAIRRGPESPDARATLIYIYRGDFCPFARFELADLASHADEFRRAGAAVIAISADPVERSKMLAAYLGTTMPLLSDSKESVLGPLGLVQHHRDGEPDNAIPAFVIVDRGGIVRWTLAPAHYSELPWPDELLDAVRAVTHRGAH